MHSLRFIPVSMASISAWCSSAPSSKRPTSQRLSSRCTSDSASAALTLAAGAFPTVCGGRVSSRFKSPLSSQPPSRTPTPAERISAGVSADLELRLASSCSACRHERTSPCWMSMSVLSASGVARTFSAAMICARRACSFEVEIGPISRTSATARSGRSAGTKASFATQITGLCRMLLLLPLFSGVPIIFKRAEIAEVPSFPPSAPSISSRMSSLGRLSPNRGIACMASFSPRIAPTDRSSDAFTSCGWYPACRATTCASVVLPKPGGPHSSSTRFAGPSPWTAFSAGLACPRPPSAQAREFKGPRDFFPNTMGSQLFTHCSTERFTCSEDTS
mmetsp:Transcript_18395/g.42854  ORF Transcript_18395/g.42854 Transcript_18395/m.42854 type:complete len:333 (-) Transcript_18395:124-1122(-)